MRSFNEIASPLEQFVHSVRTLSTQGNFRDLCELLCKSTDILIKNGQHLDAVLECLQQHSLGMLSVLIIKLSLPPPAQASNTNQTQPADYQEIRFTQVQEFISSCVAEQIRYAPDAFAELCHMITQQLVEAKSPMRGIELISIAIKKLQTNDSQLTLVHADLCQLCLLAKCFKPAFKFLDIDITSIATQEGVQFDPKYFLLYYYYGGMIYAAVKNYERALYMFEVVISTPAMAVSHIMLEAYKKYILVSLILHGKIFSSSKLVVQAVIPLELVSWVFILRSNNSNVLKYALSTIDMLKEVLPIPKYVSQVVGRFIKPLSQSYHEMSNVYATNSTEELRQIVTKYTETFTRDDNMGLAKQVVASLYKKNIQRLTKTFLTLSLSDVASRVQLNGPVEAEKYVLHMIEDGEIFATINQKDGMVIFHDDPEKYNSPTMLCRLEDEMTLCTELDQRIQKMEEEILVNPQYVKKSCGAAEEDITSGQTTKMSYLM